MSFLSAVVTVSLPAMSAFVVQLNAGEFQPLNTQATGEQPLTPVEAVRRLQVPPGFQIRLAAAEPDVRQPVAIAFDDRGRLWVAESYSYDGSTFTDERRDRILIFEDTSGDGVLDQRRVFCDGLTHLTGLTVGFGGVWVTAPPHLAFLPDRNQDDVPDGDPIVLLDGWSLKAEHNSVNGLTWGPDGWLYGRHGIKQPSFVGRPGDAPDRRLELSCSIWRYHPTRRVFEVVADGTINPWGLDFDDHGQGFLTTSVVEHLWHLVPGAHYERWKNRGVQPSPYVYEAMSATSDHLHWSTGLEHHSDRRADGKVDFGGGHAHCEAMIYLGDRWPARYRGSVFMSNIHGRRINRDQIVRDAGPYRAVHADDFLIAADPWFRAVSMKYGPDGDVYLTDWSDNGECHDRDGVHRSSGRIYKITWGRPIHVQVDLAAASTERLVEYQLHSNDWFVRHARRLLQERAAAGQDMSAAHVELQRLFRSHPDVTRKLRVMWTLFVTGGLNDAWLIRQLGHRNEHVRAWAVRLLVDQRLPPAAAVRQFTELAQSEKSWLVRMALASALQRVPQNGRWATAIHLAEIKPNDGEQNLQRMIWYAIEPVVALNPERALQTVERVAPRLRRWMARRITEDSEKSMVLLFDALEQAARPDVLTDLLTGFNQGIGAGQIVNLPGSVDPVIRKLVHHDQDRVRVAAATTAAVVGDAATVQDIRRLLHDRDSDPGTRRAVLTGLVRRRHPQLAADLQRLIQARQLTTSSLLAAMSVNDPDLAQTVLDGYSDLTQSDRSIALDFLAARRASARLLLDAIENKELPVGDLTAGLARQIAALNDVHLRKRLESLWGTVRKSSAARQRQIRDWERRLDPSRISQADLKNGRQLFRRTCAACHRLFGEGRTIGPELTGSNRRNLHYLLSSVIDPDAAVPADFRLAIVATSEGRVISGAISRRTDSTLTIQTATEPVQIRLDDIEMLKMSPRSMMPDGLLDKLSESEIRDLFAWLMSAGPVAAELTVDSSDGLPGVVLLGDSIRINYQQTVISELRDQASVWSPDENCRDTTHTLKQLEKWISGRDVSVVHLNAGLHDLYRSVNTDQPRRSPDVYEANLRKIFGRLRELTDAQIVFALTTPVDEERQAASAAYGRVVRHNPDIVRYNRIAARVAMESGVQINDVYSIAAKAGIRRVIREDGVHLTQTGADVVGRQVARAVLSALRQKAASVKQKATKQKAASANRTSAKTGTASTGQEDAQAVLPKPL